MRSKVFSSWKATIVFVDLVSDNKSNRAEFIRIPPNTSVVKVKELLYQQWFSEVRIDPILRVMRLL